MNSASTSDGGSDTPGPTDDVLATRLAFFDLGPADEARLAALGPVRAPQMDALIDGFYAHLLRFPPLAALLTATPSLLDRVKQLQRGYFHGLTRGRIDAAYVEGRLRVGAAHARIGVEPAWYIGGFSVYLRLWLRQLLTAAQVPPDAIASLESIIKLVMFDMSLAIDTYIHGGFVARRVADDLEARAASAVDALHDLQTTDQAKSELASMVVHDLKNPVSGILMLVRLALRKGDDLPEAHRGYLRQIERTGHEMLRLIQNLLEIAKLEAGKMPVACEVVDVRELVEEIVRDYAPLAEQNDQHLRVALPASCTAHADAALLKRVLANVVVNALRHSGSDVITIDVAPGPGMTLRVSDRGRGIAPERFATLFVKFESGASRRDDVGVQDTGLGLPFCKLAVERMGGRIEAESTPGSGTTFRIVLPSASSV